MQKSRPVVITFAILAGLQVITSATGLSDIVPAEWLFLLGILVAAVQVGMTFYVQNVVVPVKDTAAYVDQEGNLVPGPASPPELQGDTVEVVPARH